HDCARATLSITPQHVAQGLWGGKKLAAGTYDVWYEDARSWERKLALVRKYGLKGAGAWALGQEPESVWPSYYEWLRGLSFSDTKHHWAAGVIERVKDAGLVAGLPDGRYAPDAPMTRAESIVLTCQTAGIRPITAAGLPPDAERHWAGGYLAAALRSELITGLPDGSLRPDAVVSRAEMAVLLAKILHLPDTVNGQQKVFPDVGPGHWAARSILTLAVHDVIAGTPGGLHRPERHLTRAEAAQIVYNTFPLPKDFPGTELAEMYIAPR
ncbi:MAG: S-layer homology domain-containing protein, partial [Oscillospiraceae bacterium]|nr:S-layer homology domain-containing protein [Oscillospiraceae bacterium]